MQQKIKYKKNNASGNKIYSLFAVFVFFLFFSYIFWPYLTGSDARDLSPENPVGADLISSSYSRSPSKSKSHWESVSHRDINKRLTSMYDYIDPFDQYENLEYVEHEVESGESLWSIAELYGRKIYSIASVNYSQLVKRGYLPEGLILRVPNKDGILTRLSRGQTLWDLQNSYGVSYKKIMKFNDIETINKLHQDMELFIPGARPLNPYKYRFDHGGGSGEIIWPVDPRSRRITSGFGTRNHPLLNREIFHSGIDLAGDYGASAFVARAGQVQFVGKISGYGRAVTVVHSSRLKTFYAHLNDYSVKRGQYVEKGEKIGKIGSTGHATGPHLHFEIRISGEPVDPLKYLP